MRLYQKSLLAALPLTVLSAGAIVYYSRLAVGRALLEDIESRVTARAEASAASLADSFQSGKERELLPRLQDIAGRPSNAYASAIDSEGRVLADTGIVSKGRILDDDFTRLALRSSSTLSRTVTRGGKSFLEVLAPVWEPAGAGDGDNFIFDRARPHGSRRLGLFRLGISLAVTQSTQDRVGWAVTWVVAACSAATCLVICLIVQRLLGPIAFLVEGVQRVGRGEPGVRVCVATRDEIGELSARFNQMSDDLARTTVSKDHLARILENTADALFVTDEDGRISLTNPAARRMTGFDEGELLDRRIHDLFEAGPVLGLGPGVELSLSTKTGRRLPVLWSSSWMGGAGRGEQGFVCSASDLTDRKRAEAGEADKERVRIQRDFIANVSHDLRTPLTAIKGFAETILRDEDASGETVREFTETILINADRLAGLIEELLALSVLETGARRMSPAPVALDPFVREFAASIAPLLAKSGARLSVEIAPEISVLADSGQLAQVFQNLIDNAVKFSGAGAAIDVSARRGERQAVVSVIDSGPGIAADDLPRVFGRWARGQAASEAAPGLGLGLAIVKQIIESHGGRIWAESPAGRGAAFHFTLPLA